MKYRILYLCETQAESASILSSVYEQIVRENLLHRLYYDGTVTSREGFVADVLRPGSLPFLILGDDTPACFTWFNSIEGRSVRGHFTFFHKFWGYKVSVPIARNFFRYALSIRDDAGYLLDCIVGITPKHNTLSWKFALQCGCQLVGTIPKFLYMADSGLSVDAVAVTATRESFGMIEGEVQEAVWEE